MTSSGRPTSRRPAVLGCVGIDDGNRHSSPRSARRHEELRRNQSARRRRSHARRRGGPRASGRQWRRQVDALAGDQRACATRRGLGALRRRASGSEIAARGSQLRHRDGNAGNEPRTRLVGHRKHLPAGAGPAGAPLPQAHAAPRRANPDRTRPGSVSAARSRSAGALRGAEAARRDRQSVGAQRQSDYLRRTDGVFEPR